MSAASIRKSQKLSTHRWRAQKERNTLCASAAPMFPNARGCQRRQRIRIA